MLLLRSDALLRATVGLMLAQAAHSAAVTVNALAAVQLSSQKALGGLAGMAVLGRTALAAYLVGYAMVSSLLDTPWVAFGRASSG